MKQPAVYIMSSKPNGTIYTGVTSNLPKRAWEHRTSATTGFTSQNHCKFLVWFELHDTMDSAITREKQLKSGPRITKLRLIESTNPTWRDLYPTITK